MKKRRVFALLLAVTMAAGTLAGCGGGDTSTSSDSATSGEEGGSEGGNAESGEVIGLTFFSADANQDDPWIDPVAEAITEATGVRLKTDRPVGRTDDDRYYRREGCRSTIKKRAWLVCEIRFANSDK